MKKNKEEKTADVETIVISETKNKNGKVVKRQVVEQWEYQNGKKESFTFHEELSRSGTWLRNKVTVDEKKSKHLHDTKVIG